MASPPSRWSLLRPVFQLSHVRALELATPCGVGKSGVGIAWFLPLSCKHFRTDQTVSKNPYCVIPSRSPRRFPLFFDPRDRLPRLCSASRPGRCCSCRV
ncbi:hypothetical protein F4680DRAFT_239751 [Xylaria scruposa]|nr:hypothetical protein F4680DRAFT_239751 [Xylaria scruposa]